MIRKINLAILFVSAALFCFCSSEKKDTANDSWTALPQDQWPQVTMINDIEYTDGRHPVAGCSFLLDTGNDTIAVTAKHILTYFKSAEMNSVSFNNTFKSWKMYPKNSVNDIVVIDKIINEDSVEPVDKIPSKKDWLLFSVKEKSKNIKPLKFRTTPLIPSEDVYIIGWRYTEKNCTLEKCLIKLRRMTGKRAAARENHTPGNVGYPAVQFSVNKIADASKPQANGEGNRVDIGNPPEIQPFFSAEKYPTDDQAQHAAMKGHASLPGCKNFRRVIEVIG